MEYENPFTPGFGEIPAHLAGRQNYIRAFERAFASDRRRPELTTLFSGARGTGKTTLLTVLSKRAESAGWVAVSSTSEQGLLDDVEIQTRRALEARTGSGHRLPHVASVSVAGVGGVSFSDSKEPLSNWRSRMSDLIDALADSGAGLLITVDEVDPSLPETRQLVSVYQHFVREGRHVALIMAGLPHNISQLLADKTVSFLRRAERHDLTRIPDYEIESAFSKTIRDFNRKADSAGVSLAVDTIHGFPFLMQLVGYRSWDVEPASELITYDDFAEGIRIAQQECEARILEATYLELSERDVDFLVAMLSDRDSSRVSDLGRRLGMSSSQVAQYRKRLIDAGVIEARGRGVVAFSLPFFEDYLMRQVE